MKKLLLVSIVCIAQQYAAEPSELIKTQASNQIFSGIPGNTIIPFTMKKSAVIVKKSRVKKPQVSPAVAAIIAKAELVLESKGKYTQEFQKAKKECLRELKRTTSAYERAQLAEVHAKFYQ